MQHGSKYALRRPLGRVSKDTKGATGPDLEMLGLWHKPGLAN